MTKIRSTKTDSKNISEPTKIFQWLSSPNPKNFKFIWFFNSYHRSCTAEYNGDQSKFCTKNKYSLAHELKESTHNFTEVP